MKAFKNYDKTKRNTGDFVERLPVGGYVCIILSAKVEQYGKGEKLVIAFDIAEGEYAGYFQKQYDGNNFEDKKWKGTLGLWLPKDDGSEFDEKTKERFKSAMCDVEDSNNNYTWDWDEKKLKGKLVGILFNEGEYNGRRYTQAYQTKTADDVRMEKYRIWQPELKSKDSADEINAQVENVADDDDDDLPF